MLPSPPQGPPRSCCLCSAGSECANGLPTTHLGIPSPGSMEACANLACPRQVTPVQEIWRLLLKAMSRKRCHACWDLSWALDHSMCCRYRKAGSPLVRAAARPVICFRSSSRTSTRGMKARPTQSNQFRRFGGAGKTCCSKSRRNCSGRRLHGCCC